MLVEEVAAAQALLSCSPGARPAEVRAAYRRALQRLRPDLGGVDGAWTVRLQSARDLLLQHALPERRRRPRREAGSQYVPLRRATWGLEDGQPPSVVTRL